MRENFPYLLQSKSQMAARSARLLLEADDSNGAIDRAYFAMFHAARAILASIDPELAASSTDRTIIRRFAQHVVRERRLNVEIGKSLRRVFDARAIADYDETEVGPERAKNIVETMERFLEAVSAGGDPS